MANERLIDNVVEIAMQPVRFGMTLCFARAIFVEFKSHPQSGKAEVYILPTCHPLSTHVTP
jgi:hypothetical protein